MSEISSERSHRPGLLTRRLGPLAFWQVGILAVMVAGFIAATVASLPSRTVQGTAREPVTAGLPTHPSSIGTPYAAPSPGHSAAASNSPSPSPSASPRPSPGSTSAGWQKVRNADYGTMAQDPRVSHSGHGSLRLTVAPGGYVFADLVSQMAAQPGYHTYASWIRTQGSEQQKVCIYLLFYDAAGHPVGSDHNAFSIGGSHDWAQVSLTLATPAGATRADLQLRLSDKGVNQGGSAWFDDITVAGS